MLFTFVPFKPGIPGNPEIPLSPLSPCIPGWPRCPGTPSSFSPGTILNPGPYGLSGSFKVTAASTDSYLKDSRSTGYVKLSKILSEQESFINLSSPKQQLIAMDESLRAELEFYKNSSHCIEGSILKINSSFNHRKKNSSHTIPTIENYLASDVARLFIYDLMILQATLTIYYSTYVYDLFEHANAKSIM
ncbi:hypothetical protein BpHYR1_030314 [Brachionus plicatilis]|uniref:Uncharacterized protein n=1 Tax=Brachionus plicatilis TaxID=10195 RepID=A0A3M7RR88_BRAPC|nr:hypothetical protein BpHYR1_030314 [Brachionus plicatilis]